MNLTEIQSIVGDVSYKNWSFYVGSYHDISEETHRIVPYLQVRFPAKENGSHMISVQYGRKWLLSQHMTRSEIVQTCLKAVLTAEEHEAREQFLFEGESIFNPHLQISMLKELVKHKQFDVRKPIED